MAKANRIVGVDLGTTKIAVIIAEPEDSGNLRVIGVGCGPSEGMRRGVIINLERAVQSIEKAVAAAARMAGYKVDSCYAGISGSHIESITSHAMVAISRPGTEITRKDVERVIDQARTIALPPDREIIHAIPVEFIVDNERGIKDPVGMAGVKLEAYVHLVTAAITSAQNIHRALERAGMKVKDLVLQPLASSFAVLEPDEMNLGVALLDIGGGTTDLAIFYDGAIRHTQVIPLGGEYVTNDIAIGLRTPPNRAEEIKLQHGAARLDPEEKDTTITVPGIGGRENRTVSKQFLISIINPRVEEILMIAHKEIKKTEYADLIAAGAVITGGTARLKNIDRLAEEIFNLPVKIGIPKKVGGLTDIIADPIYATGIGLVFYGYEMKNRDLLPKRRDKGMFDALKTRFENLIKYF